MNLTSLQKLISLNLTTEQMAGVVEVLTVELAPYEAMKADIEASKRADSDRQKVRNARMSISRKEWNRRRRAVIQRDGYSCSYCGKETMQITVDHIVPLYLGGSSDLKNLTVACHSCNSSKGRKTVEEWRARCQ